MRPLPSQSHLDVRELMAALPPKAKSRGLRSSITFKIFALFFLVGLTPVIASGLLFSHLSTFNQSLQDEALESIDEISKFYRAWVKSEAQRIAITKESLEAQVRNAVLERGIRSEADVIADQEFQSAMAALFSHSIAENDIVLEVELFAGNRSLLRVGTSPESPAELKIRQHNIDILLANESQRGTVLSQLFAQAQIWERGLNAKVSPPSSSDFEAVELEGQDAFIIEATDQGLVEFLPIDSGVDSGSPRLPSSKQALAKLKADALAQPEDNGLGLDPLALGNRLPKPWVYQALPALNPNETIRITLLFGISRLLADRYEILGERRHLHRSLSNMESDDDTAVSMIYLRFFMIVLVVVLALVIASASLLAYPLSRRISRLMHVTERVADGDLDAHLEVEGSDQISFLMSQFNSMVQGLKVAQESRKYVERMEAWQEVARHLAHEIKNPLTPLLLVMQQLDRKFDDYIDRPEKYRKLVNDVVEIVNEEATTLQKLVREFSEFARLPIPDKKPTVFWDFVKQCLQLNPQYEEAAKRIELHTPSDKIIEKKVFIDHELLRRVVINIVRNGIEASKNAGFEAEIDIELREIRDEINGRDCLLLIIMDNGPGLTNEQKEKLFTPYFTTKADGTGLGLAIVRKIIEDHGGSIQIHDRDDGLRGAQVDIII